MNFYRGRKLIRENKYKGNGIRLLLKIEPQEIYYYAVEKTNFKPRPFRTQGTYGKYASIDDKIDDLHYYYFYKVWN